MAALLPAGAEAAPGDLDPSYGVGGRTTALIGNGVITREGRLLPDGRLVATGPVLNPGGLDVGVLRLTSAGSLDPSFGGGSGVATVNPTSGEDDWVVGLALQADGKPVVGGYFGEGTRNAGIVRLRTDGLPDTGFGTAGVAQFKSVIATNVGGAVLVLPDGKLLWAGWEITGGEPRLSLIRFDAAGNLDGGFGTGGVKTHDLRPGTELEQYRAIALQPDGKIVVGGEVRQPGTGSDFALVRLLPNGDLDGSFDGDGVALLHFSGDDYVNDIALQPDGKIVAAGGQDGGGHDIAVARFLPSGALDPSFDGDGKRTIDLGGSDGLNGVALQSNGKIVLAGETDASGDKDMVVHRLTAGGASDPGFGVGGTKIVDFAGFDDEAEDVVVQADGRIIAVGIARIGTVSWFAAARLEGDPAPTAPPAPPPTAPDRAVSIQILGKRIAVNRKGVAKLRLKCPASEANPPCRGRLVLRTRGKLVLGKGKKAKKRRVVLAKGGFKVAKGRTKVVRVKLGKRKAGLLKSKPSARKVLAIARVRDGAGNKRVVRKGMRAVPVKAKKGSKSR